MIKEFLNLAFTVGDESDKYNERLIHNYIQLLEIAEQTNDTALYKETRLIANEYLTMQNPLGYLMLAEWFLSQKDVDNSLMYHMLASQNGIGISTVIVKDFLKKAKTDSSYALLLAESCFMIGQDDKGMRLLKRCAKMGSETANLGISIRKAGNVKRIHSFEEVGTVVDSFTTRLFCNYVFDYSALEYKHHNKVLDFCKGYAFAKGADLKIDEHGFTMEMKYGLSSRVLVERGNNAEQMQVRMIICDSEYMHKAIENLLEGKMVVADFSSCPKELENSFFTLSGVCFALGGDLKREDNDTFIFVPKLKEYYLHCT